MKRTILDLFLVAGTITALTAAWVLNPDHNKRNFEVLPGMADSVPYDSYAVNPNFADGKTLQPLVRGVIPRGSMPLHYAATPDDAKRAGLELVSPIAPNDAKALDRGAVVYANYCEVCHGISGKGDGPVSQRGYPTPPSLLAPNALGLKDGQIFHITTYGQANMPPYAAQITREDRWRVVAYVRALQKSVTVEPKAVTGDRSTGSPAINAVPVQPKASNARSSSSVSTVTEKGARS